jgi:hypothetical protein
MAISITTLVPYTNASLKSPYDSGYDAGFEACEGNKPIINGYFGFV